MVQKTLPREPFFFFSFHIELAITTLYREIKRTHHAGNKKSLI